VSASLGSLLLPGAA